MVKIKRGAMRDSLMVALGGALGGVCRFGLSVWLTPLCRGFPYPTLLVNSVGCFIFGLCLGLSAHCSLRWLALSQQANLFVLVGFCGGLTTFSSLIFQSFAMIKNGAYWHALAYIILSFLLGLLVLFLGYYLGEKCILALK